MPVNPIPTKPAAKRPVRPAIPTTPLHVAATLLEMALVEQGRVVQGLHYELRGSNAVIALRDGETVAILAGDVLLLA